MATNGFSRLCSPESTRKHAEWVNDEIETEQVLCPLNPGHRRGGKRLTDLSVTLPRGNVQDFVWTWYSECLIQDHVLDLFQREGFTGFDVKPVKARFKSGAGTPPTLWELVRTGWGGLAKPESGIVRTRYCEECKSVRYSGIKDVRQLVDNAQWDKSDFFMVWPMPLFTFVTQRVADCVRDYRLIGAVLKEVRGLSGIGKNGFTPGRMSYWMPEALARKRGEAAGIEEI